MDKPFSLKWTVETANRFADRAKTIRSFPALYTSLADRYERAAEYLMTRIYR